MTQPTDAPAAPAEQTRRCPRCGVTRPLTEFLRDARHENGRRPECAPCSAIRRKQLRAQKKEAAMPPEVIISPPPNGHAYREPGVPVAVADYGVHTNGRPPPPTPAPHAFTHPPPPTPPPIPTPTPTPPPTPPPTPAPPRRAPEDAVAVAYLIVEADKTIRDARARLDALTAELAEAQAAIGAAEASRDEAVALLTAS